MLHVIAGLLLDRNPQPLFPSIGEATNHRFLLSTRKCRKRYATSVGEPLFRCIVENFEGAAQGPDFHLLTHLKKRYELKSMLRNFTCSIDDMGSSAVETVKWTWEPSDRCRQDVQDSNSFVHRKGFLPKGNDLHIGLFSIAEAKVHCNEILSGCKVPL
jgi:hypothetical protein